MRKMRALLTVGALFYTALVVVPLVRLGDDALALLRGDAWSALDAVGYIDAAKDDALWQLWGVLWIAACVFWWVACPALVVAARRVGVVGHVNAGSAFGSAFFPGFASVLMRESIVDVVTALKPWMGEGADLSAKTQDRICRAVPLTALIGVCAAFILAMVAAAAGKEHGGGQTLLSGFLVLAAIHGPVIAVPAVRIAQILSLRRILGDVAERRDVVRAASVEPVGG